MDGKKPRTEPVVGDLQSNLSLEQSGTTFSADANSADESSTIFKLDSNDGRGSVAPDDKLAADIVKASLDVDMDSQTNHVLTDTYRRFLLAKEWLEYREKSLKNYVALVNAEKLPIEQRGKEQNFFHFEDHAVPQIMKDYVQKVEPDELGFYESSASAILPGHDGKSTPAVFSQAYLSSKFEDYVKERHPDVYKNFEQKIQQQVSALYKNEENKPADVVQRAAAIEYLLHKNYPGLRNELEAKSKSEPHSNYKIAFSILSKTAMVINPTPALVSYTVGALLKTDAMKPFVQSVASATAPLKERVRLVAEPAARKLLGVLPQEHGGKVLAGLAVAGVAAMYFSGIITEDDAIKLKDSVVSFVENTVDSLSDRLDSAQQLAYEHGVVGDKPLTLSPTALSDGVSFDSPSTQASDLSAPESHSAGNVNPGSDIQESAELRAVDAAPATPDDILNALNSSTSIEVGGGDVPSGLSESAPPVITGSNYKIVSGDCLSLIAQAKFESAGVPYNYSMIMDYVNEIAAANDISDPNVIRAGDEIQIPSFTGGGIENNPIPPVVLEQASNALFEQAMTQDFYDMNLSLTPPDSQISAWGAAPELFSANDILALGSNEPGEFSYVMPPDISQLGVVPDDIERTPSAEDLLSPFNRDAYAEPSIQQASPSPRPRF